MPLRILIVDDSKMVRLLLRKALGEIFSGTELDLSEAQDGREALASAAERPYELIFLDLTMPGMSGFQVLEQLREARFAGKVIVLSADGQEGAVEQALALGAAKFIEKPVAVAPIAAALHSIGLL